MTLRVHCDSCGKSGALREEQVRFPLPDGWESVRFEATVRVDLCLECVQRVYDAATKHRRMQEASE